jgi:hypothetical protein
MRCQYKFVSCNGQLFELDPRCDCQFSFLTVSEIIEGYAVALTFRSDVWDIFNDQIDWQSKKSWYDLKELNAKIPSIVGKFSLLDQNNPKVAEELAKYLENMEIIQLGLGGVDEILSQRSRKQEFADELLEVNRRLSVLRRNGVIDRSASFCGGTILDIKFEDILVKWYGRGWKLQYKATRDGWESAKFHALCDGCGPTITLISTGNSLFGGYLSQSWHATGKTISDSSAELFTLSNVHGIAPTRFKRAVSHSTDEAFGTICFGPTFGGGYDICIANRSNENSSSRSNFPYTFADTTGRGNKLFAGDKYFTPTEIEVFVLPNGCGCGV